MLEFSCLKHQNTSPMSTHLLSLGKQANFPFPLCKQCDYMIQQQLASDMATKVM